MGLLTEYHGSRIISISQVASASVPGI